MVPVSDSDSPGGIFGAVKSNKKIYKSFIFSVYWKLYYVIIHNVKESSANTGERVKGWTECKENSGTSPCVVLFW